MVYVIAEIGSNHDGSISKAKRMIESAKECGADAVKFQIFTADNLYVKKTEDFDKYKDVWLLIKGLEVDRSFFDDCFRHCKTIGIEFLATPFHTEAVDFLVEMGVSRIKIASFEFTDVRLVKHIVRTKLPIIASTGLCTLSEIIDMCKFIRRIRINTNLTLLHCNSAYPTPDVDANLLMIPKLKSLATVGYSDHTWGTLAAPLAVALGAEVIEKHFTLNRGSKGPDHEFALEPCEFQQMVEMIRQAECFLGNSDFSQRSKSEQTMFYAKRSVVAARFIPQGKVIEELDITTKRPAPGGCIPARQYFDVIGFQALRDIQPDSILTRFVDVEGSEL